MLTPQRVFDPHVELVMRVDRKLLLGLTAGVAAVLAASAPAFASALPFPWIKECYFTQSNTGGFTIEECRRFVPWRFYGVAPLHRFQ